MIPTFYAVAVLLMIFLPLGAAIWLRRRIHLPWWLFLLGVLTFAGAQAYHIPLNNWLTDLGIIGAVGADAPNLLRTAMILGFSAGLSESIARAAGYGLLFRLRRENKWADSLLIGLGHGGIEAMVLGGVLTAATVTSLWGLQGTDLQSLELPADQLQAITLQLERFLGAPYLAVFPVLERIIAMSLHIILSLLVWRAFSRRQPLYFVAAVLLHTVFDAVAVLIPQFNDSPWLIEGVLLLTALPGLIWLIRVWRAAPKSTPSLIDFRSELRLLAAAVAKELQEQWRTKRFLIIAAVFAVFGMSAPLLANFLPEMLRNLEETREFADLIPTPSAGDALAQYVESITQFGFILVIVLGMGAVAGEKERRTAAMILSKPLPRWAFLLSKFLAQAAALLAGMMIATAGAYYYTIVLFGEFDFWGFVSGNLLLYFWLLIFAAITLLGSTIAGGTAAAAGIALAAAVGLLLAGAIPLIAPIAPGALVSWASTLGLNGEHATSGGALAVGLVLINMFLIAAVAVFEKQEL